MGSQHPLQLLHLLFGWKRIVLVLVWPQIKDSLEVVLSAPPIPLLSSCAFLLPNASCLGLASGTTPKLAPAFKQIHSSFLSAGAEGGGYYPRVEMSSNGRRPRSVCTRIPVTSPSLTSRPGLKLDQFKKNLLRTSPSHRIGLSSSPTLGHSARYRDQI